jgi:hypothetical protein
MNCPRCRGVAPAGVSFCPHCGNDLRLFRAAAQAGPIQAAAIPNTVPVKEQLKKAAKVGPVGYFEPQVAGVAAMPLMAKKSKLPWIIAAAILLILIGSGLLVLNMLKKTGHDGSALQANGIMPGSMLKKTGNEAPFLAKTGDVPPPVKEPDLRWLYHLEKIEQRRGELSKKGLAKFMVMAQPGQFGTDMKGLNDLTTGDPEANMPDTAPDMISKESDHSKKEWAQLRADFDSFPPPPDCVTIAEPYGHALDETRAMMTDVMDAIAGSKEDPQKALTSLYAMQNKSKSIDTYGNTADERVQALCSKYNKRKWFSVNSDFGNSSIFGSLGIK